MTRYLYLAAIAFSAAGVVFLDRRLRLGVSGHRLLRAIAVTVPFFLAIDALGAARGWFRSNPGLNVVILPPGISVEEPLLLSFLVLLSIVMWRGASRWIAGERGAS